MIVAPNPSPVPPPTSAAPEPPVSEYSATSPVNAEKIESSEEGVDLIGDATSWPSLSESTRPSPRSSPAPPSDPPIADQAPAISHSPQNHRHHNTNATPNPNSNPNRQRSSSRGGSSRGGASRGWFIRHPAPPHQPPPSMPPTFYGGFESQIRGPFFYGNGFAAHPRPTDHQFSQSSSSHRGGHFNNANYRGPPQGFHPRDLRFPMGFPMPPHQVVPYQLMHPPVFPPEHFMGMPPYTGGHAPVPPLSLSPPPQVDAEVDDLKIKLINQINYYFSDDNLVKDIYLRKQMDSGGWVPISLIANFRKVRELTHDIQLILEALGTSSMVEVQGDKIRRRHDGRRWILTSSAVSQGPTADELNTTIRYLQNATMEEVRIGDRSSSSANNTSLSRREVSI